MKKNIIIIQGPHSIVDLITNSSTELFIIDKNKTLEAYQSIIDILYDMGDIDYESTICKFEDYEYKDDFIIPEEYNKDDLYIIDASYHNTLLNKFIEDFFHVVELTYKD